MKDGKIPNPITIHPIAGYDKEIYVKPTLKNPIITGTGDALLEINPENPQPKPNVGPEFSGVALAGITGFA